MFFVVMTCLKPAEIAHGRIVTPLEKEDIVVDDIIEYSCDASYALHGNRFITCNEDGNYNLPPPTCKSKRIFLRFVFGFCDF